MKQRLLDYLILLSVAGLVVLLDQWIKSLVRTHLSPNEIYRPDLWITQYVRILHLKNSGTIGGIFQNMGGFFTVLSILISITVLLYFPQVPRQEWMLRLSLCLVLGGGVGNLIDRLSRGYVTDFVSVGNFLVFNVADASLSVGIALCLFAVWQHSR
ncbi:MAG: signal peptidase II [Chloroflexota bacterium]